LSIIINVNNHLAGESHFGFWKHLWVKKSFHHSHVLHLLRQKAYTSLTQPFTLTYQAPTSVCI